MDVRRLVRRIADALGPDAAPAQVEAVAGAVLDLAEPPGPPASDDEAVVVRRLTLGISLRDCASRLPQTVRARVYDKIRRTASPLAHLTENLEARYCVRIAERHVAVTPVALVADGLARDELIGLAQLMDTAARHVSVQRLDGLAALVEGGMTEGDRRLLAALPDALATTERVGASIQCGTTATGLNAEAVTALAQAIRDTARLTAEDNAAACTRLTALCNAALDPFAHGAFHPPGAGEATLHVEVSATNAVLHALRAVGPDAEGAHIADAIQQRTLPLVHVGEAVGRYGAERLSQQTGVPSRFGSVRLSLAPTPATSTSLLDVLNAMGVNGPGTTAAMVLLDDALRTDTHSRSDLRLDAAFPGDIPVETLDAVLRDALTAGLTRNRTTACRLIPVSGTTAGESVDFGEPLGRMPILDASSLPGGLFA